MSDQTRDAARPTDPVGRVLFNLSRTLAIFGGVLCCLVAAMVTVSVTGRYLFAAPVPGDYDLVGIIIGCAIFVRLPQLTRGNIVVDFFTTNLGARASRARCDRVAVVSAGRCHFLVAHVLAYSNFAPTTSRSRHSPFTGRRSLNIICMIVLIAVIAYTLTRDIDDVRLARVRRHRQGE
jgi:TRAP-type C4-dicarboxylate transport system permease small subunit